MSRKDKERLPVKISMELDKSKLQNIPPEMEAVQLFTNVIVNAFVSVSQKKNGMDMKMQRTLYNIRTTMEQAVEAKETSCEITYLEFKTLKEVWDEQTPQANMNELIMLVEANLIEAGKQHTREESKN